MKCRLAGLLMNHFAHRFPGRVLLSAAGVLLLGSLPAAAQDNGPATLQLGDMVPGGVRIYATDAWGSYNVTITNVSERDRLARVLASFVGFPDVQYGRDVWVPANTTISTWILVGPAPVREGAKSCEIEVLLYDRTDGVDRLIRPTGEEHLRTRRIIYRKREAITAMLLDKEVIREPVPGAVPQPDSRDSEAMTLARTFRLACNPSLSEYVSIVQNVPPRLEALDGVEHFVLASNRLAHDPAGMRALREWVEHGGRLWVMLDRVDATAIAPLLGDALDFEVVERVSLTHFAIATRATGRLTPEARVQQHELPVDFVRVLLPREEHPRHMVGGWPVWFTRPLGRGKVVFTTLGPRGWHRPREDSDLFSGYHDYPLNPVPMPPLPEVAALLQPPPEEAPFTMEAFHPLLAEEIGYSIVRRTSVLLIFGIALVAALLGGLALRKSPRPELVGWLGPAAALGATAVFVAVGESSRRAVAPTVAVAQVVDAVSGTEEAPVRGLLAAYRPDSGPAEFGTEQGGFFDLDMSGIEGQARRLILTDMDAWHWENLSLPAGERLATFRYTVPTKEPITAVARFGPEGIEGELAAGPFQDLSDALLSTPNGRNLAVQLHSGGAFSASTQDVLSTGQFLASAVLSDRQQRRQELYRAFLKRPAIGRPEGPNVLLAWAKPVDMHFALAPEAQLVGSALLTIPVRLERPAPGKQVTIPGPLIPCRRIIGDKVTRPTFDSDLATDMVLRFQLPAVVLPFKLEGARFIAKVVAPGRRVTISGRGDGGFVVFHREDSPVDSMRVNIPAELLRLDDEGGLHVNLSISDPPPRSGIGQGESEKWTIEYIEVEVTGQAE